MRGMCDCLSQDGLSLCSYFFTGGRLLRDHNTGVDCVDEVPQLRLLWVSRHMPACQLPI